MAKLPRNLTYIVPTFQLSVAIVGMIERRMNYIQQHVTLEARITSDLFFVYKPLSSHPHFSFVTEKDLQGQNI